MKMVKVYCTQTCKFEGSDEEGNRMIRCDLCKGWFHEECIKVEEGENVSNFWMCEECGEDWVKVKAMNRDKKKN